MSFGRVSVLAALAIAGAPASAQLSWSDILNFEAPPEAQTYDRQRLAKAAADECFDGIGVDYPPLGADGTCPSGIPKTNLGYVWGLTQAGVGVDGFAGDEIWLGTFANPLCSGSTTDVFEPEPNLTFAWVCEFGQSMLARRPVMPLPPSLGDWRLPRAYSFKLSTGQLTDRTPADPAFLTITGLRSAGSLGTAVFIAGPTFQQDVTFAAWDAASNSYRGSCRATDLNQIRQWVVVNGVLYAGAGRDAGDGVVLRWRGTPADPFLGSGPVSPYCGFEVVASLPAFPAYLTAYGTDRLVVSAWNRNARNAPESVAPASIAAPLTAGVYLGPRFGADGAYDSTDASKRWKPIWSPLQYETDPIVASTTGGGAIAYWNGWLWWGTMHNNVSAAASHSACGLPFCYGPPANSQESLDLSFQTSRAASIWRARIGEAGVEVQLLYGQAELPALVPGTKVFEMQATGWSPRLGPAGFGNPFVTYTWAAAAGPDDLLFGTYDYRYTFDIRFGLYTGGPFDASRGYGADLWRFADPEGAATPEAVHGLDNYANYGVRNMLRLDGSGEAIVGTATGLSLLPEGGWELLRLAPAPAAAAAGR